MGYMRVMTVRIRAANTADISVLLEFQREGWFEDYREVISVGYAE